MSSDAKTIKNECVVGVFETTAGAEQAVRKLREAGLTGEAHVSLVRRELDPEGKTAAHLSLTDDSMRDATIGGALGGLTGIAGAATLISATGFGLILMTGPLVALTGAIVGAFLGAMKGWGVHDANIKHYESLVEQGKVLVIVAGEPPEVEKAELLLSETEARDVTLHAKEAADSPEIDDRPAK